MKKIFIISILAFSCLFLNAQIRNVDSGYDEVINQGNTAWFYIGRAADTLGVADTTWTKTVLIESNDELIWDIYFDVDSIGGTSSASDEYIFYTRYKEFPDDAWTSIGDSVSYAGAADTTFTLSSGATAKKARYIGVAVYGEDDALSIEIQKMYIKAYK